MNVYGALLDEPWAHTGVSTERVVAGLEIILDSNSFHLWCCSTLEYKRLQKKQQGRGSTRKPI